MFLGPVDDLESIRTVQIVKLKDQQIAATLARACLKSNIQNSSAINFGHICNVSFQMGVSASKMKIAKFIPFYMSGDCFYKLRTNIFITTVLKKSNCISQI